MLPSVVNATKKPSRAWEKTRRLLCVEQHEVNRKLHRSSSSMLLKCISKTYWPVLLTSCYLLFIGSLPALNCLTVLTLPVIVNILLDSYDVIQPPTLNWHFREIVYFIFLLSVSMWELQKLPLWTLPPALAEWTPHYWGTMASSPASHRMFHSALWCLKKTRTRIKFVTWLRLKKCIK